MIVKENDVKKRRKVKENDNVSFDDVN
jgi:hypothetical protein